MPQRGCVPVGAVAWPSLAAAGVAAPIATLAALLGGGPARIVGAVAAWAALIGFVLAAPRLWPGRAHAARAAVVLAWALAMIAFVVGFVGHYAVAIDHELCGGGGGTCAASAAGTAAVYLAGSVWALRSGRRAVWAWPILVLIGWGVHLVLLLALPGAHGYCET